MYIRILDLCLCHRGVCIEIRCNRTRKTHRGNFELFDEKNLLPRVELCDGSAEIRARQRESEQTGSANGKHLHLYCGAIKEL